ncbi:type II toxin-antitoxin system RelE/ParE family toxin [Acidicapsa acidisoli]|uniref:type II toxin-antitoxin system RelE/ParE family toxin n=1 Tax=Acidicapsa acidisoli TaxID=1615681 RepID=UPI0021DFCB11|nr:type II toxin-antitoxin system RelE/ParE family toxin [Acidicapsa acidisoli]
MKKEPSEEFSAYKSKAFARFAKKARISDADLWRTAWLVNKGVIDADLGGGVIKQRIARHGEGKSGGSRSIILFKKDDRAVFVFGFEKKDLANIKPNELEAFRELAEVLLGYTKAEMTKRVQNGALLNVDEQEERDNG